MVDEKREKNVPIDGFYFVYFIMFWEGVGNLFPWNAFITANGYFQERFCGTAFEDSFENYFSITFTVSQTVGLAISIMFQDQISIRNKIVWPLFIYGIIFAITTAFVGISAIDPSALFFLTLLSNCLCGICGAILSAGLFGLAAMFPPMYTGALMNGQGLAGLVVAVSSVVTIAAAAPIDYCDDDATDDGSCPEKLDYSALAYFIIATMILLSCISTYIWMARLPFTKYYTYQATKAEQSGSGIINPLLESDSLDYNELSINSVHSEVGISDSSPTTQEDEMDPVTTQNVDFATIYRIYKKVQTPALSVFYTFTVTIALFPGLTVNLQSTDHCKTSDRFSNDLFVPILFLFFNAFDFMGRVTAGATKPYFTAKNIWIPTAARTIFVPLFIMCKCSESQFDPVFTNDAWPLIFMFVFALTNGYCANAAMMLGAGVVEASEAALAGTIMVFALTAGLMMGAACSFLILFISQGTVK